MYVNFYLLFIHNISIVILTIFNLLPAHMAFGVGMTSLYPAANMHAIVASASINQTVVLVGPFVIRVRTVLNL